jgi:hypothetical protein
MSTVTTWPAWLRSPSIREWLAHLPARAAQLIKQAEDLPAILVNREHQQVARADPCERIPYSL